MKKPKAISKTEKHAAELEQLQTQYSAENRRLRSALEASRDQVGSLKAIVTDQQLNITILLAVIRRGDTASEINTPSQLQTGQVEAKLK